MESYVTQQTHLFHDSISNNIAIAKPGAAKEEIIAAAKKASLHASVMTLPHGYDTEVGELGNTLSGGEKQRIGIARAFLHNAPPLLLDEPISNLDSLNEGSILKSLKESAQQKTVVLVTHRASNLLGTNDCSALPKIFSPGTMASADFLPFVVTAHFFRICLLECVGKTSPVYSHVLSLFTCRIYRK